MLARRSVEHRAQFGMHRDRERLASLLLLHRKHAIANVLAAHLDDIAAPLAGVDQQRERKARLRADWMMRLKLRDLVLGPRMEPITFNRTQLDVGCRVCTQVAALKRKLTE